MTETKKDARGRKPIGKKALSSTEKMRRQRMRAKLLKEAMGNQGYVPVQIFIDPKQLQALSYIEKREGGEGLDLIDPTALSNRLFALMRDHIEANCNDLREGEPLNTLVDSGCLSRASFHRIARLEAQMQFANWSKQQIEGLK